jgi:Ca-activated chloride channel homolog
LSAPAPALPFTVLGEAARLAEPGALRLLVAVVAVLLLGAWAIIRRRAALSRAAGPLAARIAPTAGLAGPSTRLGLSSLGLALLVLALARPQCGSRTEVTARAGVDLAIVLDASRSMRARDVLPDRLGRAQLEVAALLDGLAGDRVALVAFAGDAFVQCPLTSDASAAKLFLRAVEPEAMPRQGTALADALAAAREALLAAERGARSKVVLVVSDGEDHDDGAEAAAQALADAGIRVFALAVGTPEGAPIPDAGAPAGWRKDRRGETVISRLDAAALRAVAARGGGELFDLAVPGRGLAAFRAVLDRMDKTEREGRVVVTWEDRFALVAFPALLALLAALIVPEARRRPAEEAP